MENNEKVALPSYTHDGSVERYTTRSLGEDFEISVPPENVLMAVCAHHRAKELIEDGVDAIIITLGGAARSNSEVIVKLNELTDTEIPVIADTESNSLASNMKSLSKYEGTFFILCQDFAKTRTLIHSNYHLNDRNFMVKDWESYVNETEFTEFEASLIQELIDISGIPWTRKLIEKALLIPLARLDPATGKTKNISGKREQARNKNQEKNIFTITGTD